MPTITPLFENVFSVNSSSEFFSWRKTHNISTRGIFETLGTQCDEILKLFNRKKVILLKNCRIFNKDLEVSKIMNPEYGMCFRISLENDEGIKIGGRLDGITLLLNLNAGDYLKNIKNNYWSEGIQIQMHYEDKLNLGRWITLSAGRHYLISLKEKRSQVTYSNVSRTINKVLGNSAITVGYCYYGCFVYM